jgi:hypothetical protein
MITKIINISKNRLRFAYFALYVIHLQLCFEILFLFLLTLKHVNQIVEYAVQSTESQRKPPKNSSS